MTETSHPNSPVSPPPKDIPWMLHFLHQDIRYLRQDVRDEVHELRNEVSRLRNELRCQQLPGS